MRIIWLNNVFISAQIKLMGHQLLEFVNNHLIVHLIILEILLQNYVLLIVLLVNKLMLIMIQRDVINFVLLEHLLIILHRMSRLSTHLILPLVHWLKPEWQVVLCCKWFRQLKLILFLQHQHLQRTSGAWPKSQPTP
jgi:hypothetical protein